MAKKHHPVEFSRVLAIVFSVLFGVIALAAGYSAVNNSSEIRSKAAEEQSIYKQWEFNTAANMEDWNINAPYTITTQYGNLNIKVPKATEIASLTNSSVETVMPKGNKYIVFSIAAGSEKNNVQIPSKCPKPPVCVGTQLYSVPSSMNRYGGCPAYKCIPIAQPQMWNKFKKTDWEPVLGDQTTRVDEAVLYKQAVMQKTACPMDAKICADGSSVGRTGPSCSFMPCQKSRVIKGRIYYTIAEGLTARPSDGTNSMQKPVEFSALIDGSLHEVRVLIPEIDAATIRTVRIQFLSGLLPEEPVRIDWIRLLGVVSKAPVVNIPATCVPRPRCVTGNEFPDCKYAGASKPLSPGQQYCEPSKAPRSNCRMQKVQCFKAPCPEIQVCDDQPVTTYACPSSQWIDCMPTVGGVDSKSRANNCSKTYLDWAKANCEGFKGAAY